MNEGTGAAIAQQVAHDLGAMRSTPAPAFAHVGPDLGLQHAVVTVRVGGRAVRWLYTAAMLHPGVMAAACWAGWSWLRSIGAAAAAATPIDRDVIDPASGQVLVHNTVHVGQFAGLVDVISLWVWCAAVFCTIGAVTLAGISLFSQPTHRVGPDGRLRAVNGHTSMAARRRGGYTRIKGTYAGVVDDWRQAKRDAAKVDRKLARVGEWRLKRWARRWGQEKAAGVPDDGLTRPGALDRWLFKRVKPPKAKKAKRTKQSKKDRKATRQQLDAELNAELARIESRQQVVDAGPRAGDDPAAPPVAPSSTAAEDAQQRRWAARIAEQKNETVAWLAELQAEHGPGPNGTGHEVGYVPQGAPSSNGSRP